MSRSVDRITCPDCGLDQPLSMDCAGCRRSFSLDELNAARGMAPAAGPAQGSVFRDDPAPPDGARKESVFRDDPAPDPRARTEPDPTADPGAPGDVYDPATAVHSRSSGSRFAPRQANLSSGELVQEALQGTFAAFLPVALVTLIVSAPSIFYTIYFVGSLETTLGGEDPDLHGFLLHLLGAGLVGFLCQLLSSAALTQVVGCWLRDETIVLADSIVLAVRSLGVLVFLSIVQAVGIVFGFLLLIIPGIILGVGWSVSIPAAVVERVGVTEALGRSWRLTDGNRLAIFFAFLILSGLSKLVEWLSALAVSAEAALPVDLTVGTFFTAVQAVLTALIYFKLRAADDGVPIHRVALPRG